MPCAAEAQEAGNAEAGHAYAKKVCAECHAVERGETEILNPPSLQIVADFPASRSGHSQSGCKTRIPTCRISFFRKPTWKT